METQNEIEIVDLPADVQAELKAGQVVAFSHTESALADLRKNYEGVVYDVATVQGLTDAKTARKDIVTHRTSLEKKRKEIKAPYLDYCRLLDGEAARITKELESLEKPIDDQIKAEEKRLADIKAEADRIEAARVNKHQNGLEGIRAIAGSMIGANLEALRITLEKVRAIKFSEYEEFEESARLYAESAVEKLEQLIAAQEEKIKAQAEADRLAKINARLSNIENAPAKAFGSDIKGLEIIIERLNEIDLNSFEEFAETAAQYRDEAISKIHKMLTDANQRKADFEAHERQRVEQERVGEIKHRISLILARAQNLHRYPLDHVKNSLQDLASTELLESSFGEFFEEALDAKTAVIETMQAHIASVEKANADAEELARMKAEKAAADAKQQRAAQKPEQDITNEEKHFIAEVVAVMDESSEPKSRQAEITRAQIITLVTDAYGLTNDEAENILKILFAN